MMWFLGTTHAAPGHWVLYALIEGRGHYLGTVEGLSMMVDSARDFTALPIEKQRAQSVALVVVDEGLNLVRRIPEVALHGACLDGSSVLPRSIDISFFIPRGERSGVHGVAWLESP